MGKTISLEHPELSCIRVDLDPEASIDQQVRSLVHELHANDGEDQVAYDERTRHVARLVRHTPGLNDSVGFSASATYLITGGMSGLGRLTAEWMADRGARYFALMSRTGAGEAGAAWLQALRARGANVTCFAADVSDADQVRSVLNEVAATMPPMRGIVHSAGTLAAGALLQQTSERFNQVFKAKVDGTWNLHLLSSRLSLDFFVLFSSAAAMLGSPAQANHSSANAFLDTVAHYRRSLGLPALSINWGAWSEVGSATSIALQSRLAKNGMGTIDPSQGLKVLEYLMSSRMPQTGVVPICWPEVFKRFPVGSEPPFYRSVAAAERRGATLVPTEMHRGDAPRTETIHERSNSLQDYLAARVAAALRLDSAKIDVDKPMNHMGLDSLMAIEIRNRLKNDLSIEVPVVKFLDGLSIAELGQELEKTARIPGSQAYAQSAHTEDMRSPPATMTRITPDAAAGLLARMDELSEEQLDALLRAALTHSGGDNHHADIDIPQATHVRVENNGRRRV
jgi:myxalamid-type polyketide synthase MxaE and MxaD